MFKILILQFKNQIIHVTINPVAAMNETNKLTNYHFKNTQLNKKHARNLKFL